MASWTVNENYCKGKHYREFELAYQCFGRESWLPAYCPKRVIRLWDDGGLEIGTVNSPMVSQFSDNLSAEVQDNG